MPSVKQVKEEEKYFRDEMPDPNGVEDEERSRGEGVFF